MKGECAPFPTRLSQGRAQSRGRMLWIESRLTLGVRVGAGGSGQMVQFNER